jgi:hypothetical protein
MIPDNTEPGRPSPRVRRRGLVGTIIAGSIAATAITGVAAYATEKSHAVKTDAAHTAATPAATASIAPSLAAATVSPTPTTPPPDADTLFDNAVGSLIKDGTGSVSVAVEDLTTGAEGSYDGADNQFETASIVKVDILATLLLQCQQKGTSLTGTEKSLATTMIENSDNDSATALYDDDGGASAIDDANKTFGLADTKVGTDGYWGLTQTTSQDQVRLLQAVFATGSPLNSTGQDYIRGLMSQVESDQRWGVSAAADSGTSYFVKNGWLPSSETGLWSINSIGEVQHGGHTYLVAVLSDKQTAEDSGIDHIQTVAGAAVDAMASADL